MSDTLSRIITDSGKVFGIACDTTDLVNDAIKRHDPGPTAAAALGRALTGAILLAGLLKGDQYVQLIFEGSGPLKKVIAEAGNRGWCRGYVAEPRAEVPLKDGVIDVATGIGKAGFLRVVKDIGLKEKYTGLVQLYTSEIGEDIAYYLTESEQTPSAIGLGVHLLPSGEVAFAGGYLIQSLPPADDKMISDIEANISKQDSITTMLSNGFTPADILEKIFASIPHKQTGSTNLTFACNCSKSRMEKVLRTLSQEDINYLLEQEESVEVNCDYCSSSYRFSRKELENMQT